MREIGHFIGGKEVKGPVRALRRHFQSQYRRGAGQGRARQAFRGRARHRQCRGSAGRLGGHQSAAARARDVQVPRPGAEGFREPRQAPVRRARQGAQRCARRRAARRRGGRIRLRHPAPAEGRIHRGRRPRHRPLFHAPAARRGRRHHAVQLPGHDPAVEMRPGDRLRQRLHPQAVGARPFGADAHRRTVPGGRPAARHPQRGQRRQGSGRHAAQRLRASRRSASSAPRRSRNTSTQPAPPTASACSASAAPRTT